MVDKRLQPGWAGNLEPDDLAFIKARLKTSSGLRDRWGFRTTRIREVTIRRVAMDGSGGAPKIPSDARIPLETKLAENTKPQQLPLIPVGVQ